MGNKHNWFHTRIHALNSMTLEEHLAQMISWGWHAASSTKKRISSRTQMHYPTVIEVQIAQHEKRTSLFSLLDFNVSLLLPRKDACKIQTESRYRRCGCSASRHREMAVGSACESQSHQRPFHQLQVSCATQWRQFRPTWNMPESFLENICDCVRRLSPLYSSAPLVFETLRVCNE